MISFLARSLRAVPPPTTGWACTSSLSLPAAACTGYGVFRRLESSQVPAPVAPGTTTALARDPGTSVQWVQPFDRSPVEFGVLDPDGFVPIIFRGTQLPYRRKVPFTNIFDDLHVSDIVVAWRPTPRDMFRELGVVRLTEISKVKAFRAHVSLLMEMDKTLNGKLFAWDAAIGHECSLKFNIQLDPSAVAGGHLVQS